jgi:protein-disulfide isomerase-like protein with CxxC motif
MSVDLLAFTDPVCTWCWAAGASCDVESGICAF